MHPDTLDDFLENLESTGNGMSLQVSMDGPLLMPTAHAHLVSYTMTTLSEEISYAAPLAIVIADLESLHNGEIPTLGLLVQDRNMKTNIYEESHMVALSKKKKYIYIQILMDPETWNHGK